MPQTVPQQMRALVYNSDAREYMSWESAFPVPDISNNEVLIKVISSSLNPFDFRVTESNSMFMGYRNSPVGCDVAGQIVKIGSHVAGFKLGDLVFGWGAGLAEFAVSDDSRIAKIPEGQTPADFGMYPCASVSALQMLNKHWLGRPGFQVSSILVIGAAGGVGSSVIQLARHFGGPELKIHAVSSQVNEKYLQSIGASAVMDYSGRDFDVATVLPQKSVDLIVDLVSGTPEGNDYVESGMLLLKPSGKYITMNTLSTLQSLSARFQQLTGTQFSNNYDLFLVNRSGSANDLAQIANLIQSHKLKLPVAEEVQFNENSLRGAFSKLKQRHARGKFRVIVDTQLVSAQSQSAQPQSGQSQSGQAQFGQQQSGQVQSGQAQFGQQQPGQPQSGQFQPY